MNEVLKTQFAFQLCDPYWTAMVHNYLENAGPENELNSVL